MSWKHEVVADSSGKFYSNAIRLPTEAEAKGYGADLTMRWTSVRDQRVVECPDEPANYSWVEGRLKAIKGGAA